MRLLLIIEQEVRTQIPARLTGVRVIAAVGLLVLDRAPQPLDEDVVSAGKSYSISPVGYAAEMPAEGTRHPHEYVISYERGPVETGCAVGHDAD